MTCFVQTFGSQNTTLWQLDSRTRLQRQLRQVAKVSGEVFAWNSHANNRPPNARYLYLNSDYLFDLKTLEALTEHNDVALVTEAGTEVAAYLSTTDSAEFLNHAASDADNLENLTRLTPKDLARYDDKLRRADAPGLRQISAHDAHELEAYLYGNSYKGITDLVTKWWWPAPAKVGVHWCARLGIAANAVTLFSAALMFLSLWLFSEGYYWLGLIGGWFMTFLDTVDGKLARVTVTASAFGHWLDHGMDILHPPFWYWAWGASLVAANLLGYPLTDWIAVLFTAYVAGRLIEGAFHGLGSCGMFSWRPLDAYFRLVTARRNPCLILLTLSLLIGRPDWGFIAVVAWTIVSSVLMLARLLYAVLVRLTQGQLQSWLQTPDAAARFPRAFTTFANTRNAYRQ